VPQAREFDAKKAERLRREHRFYTPDLLGRPCAVCKTPLPVALVHAGDRTHPCCDPPASSRCSPDSPPPRPPPHHRDLCDWCVAVACMGPRGVLLRLLAPVNERPAVNLPPLRDSYRLTRRGQDAILLLTATAVGLMLTALLYGWYA
jgi:hypothetical protein